MVNRHALDAAAGLRRIGIESRHDIEPLLRKAAIAQQGPAKVAGPDQDRVPALVGAQNAANRRHQLITAIANARVAKVPEVGQVLANLGVGEAEPAAELTAARRGMPLVDEVL